ncbi:MAG: hypothetical protein HRU69_08935 [Flammeovirgaceae bacterium]|nr:MAG: hypothetical protein HRU69_08935 [Flammeovirgaceae bacterium]
MKNQMKNPISLLFIALAVSVYAQKVDLARMDRDIEVAENALQTLIKQQFVSQRMFFPLEIEGSYQEGFGVTFRLPPDYTTPMAISFSGDNDNIVILDGNAAGGGVWQYTGRERHDRARVEIQEDAIRLKEKAKAANRRINLDSMRNDYNLKVIEAAKNFILDYNELLSQLAPNERIMITNQGDQPRMWVNRYFSSPKRSHISVDALKSDLLQFKQGKLTREQMLAKIAVVNTESVDAPEPDLELLSSIFNRLYRSDLSKTYFTDNSIYYERLKNFGAVYYMKVYSSNQRDMFKYSMPTLKLDDLDQATRDKKVKELYPAFEKELKENMIEYGRTLKSLNDDEQLIVNVKLTRCDDCGIPYSIEASVKASVLKEHASGKLSKEAAVSKVVIKKGPIQ